MFHPCSNAGQHVVRGKMVLGGWQGCPIQRLDHDSSQHTYKDNVCMHHVVMHDGSGSVAPVGHNKIQVVLSDYA